jgi:hypothetical protein
MQVDYDREKCVALVKEAHQITSHLKAETKHLDRQIGRVLEGGDDDLPSERVGARDRRNLGEGEVSKSFWHFWR